MNNKSTLEQKREQVYRASPDLVRPKGWTPKQYVPTNHDHEYRCRECGCYYETKPNGWMDTTNCSQECADAYVDYLNELTHKR